MKHVFFSLIRELVLDIYTDTLILKYRVLKWNLMARL